MNNKISKFIVLLLSFTLFSHCGTDEKKKQATIDIEVKQAVESYRQRRVKECMVSITDSVNRIVDSLIRIKMTAYDTVSVMAKPTKPVKPIIKSPLDTTPVVPLVPK